jgi:hypothetical protein
MTTETAQARTFTFALDFAEMWELLNAVSDRMARLEAIAQSYGTDGLDDDFAREEERRLVSSIRHLRAADDSLRREFYGALEPLGGIEQYQAESR